MTQKRIRSRQQTILSSSSSVGEDEKPENSFRPIDATIDEQDGVTSSVSEESLEEGEMDPSDAELVSSLPITATDLEETTLEKQAVSIHDPLRRYLEDLRKYPLLESEEEYQLATKLKESGDLQAARLLVSANLRLVVKIAYEYKTFYSNLLDLIQEGNIGLMKAVSKFDPTKGARLGYYASWWIRSYILKYLLDNFRLVKIGTTQAQKKLFYHLMREKERLESQGLLAGPRLLAETLKVREKDIIEMEQRLSRRGAEMSLDAPADPNAEHSFSYANVLADSQASVEDRLVHHQLLKLLQSKLPAFEKLLNDKELKILKDRLLAEEPQTLQDIATRYGLTRERARQIEVKVIEKLRHFFKAAV